MALREEELGQKYLAGSIQYWLIVSKTLSKTLVEFVDSFLFLKWRVTYTYFALDAIMWKKIRKILLPSRNENIFFNTKKTEDNSVQAVRVNYQLQ